MYDPSVAKRIKQLFYIYPLWYKAFAFKMNSPFPRAIGAYVEGEIGQLKDNLLKEGVRADDFLKQNSIFCGGSLKIIATMYACCKCILLNPNQAIKRRIIL